MSPPLPQEAGCSSAAGRPVSPALELFNAVLVVRVVQRADRHLPALQALWARSPSPRAVLSVKWLLAHLVERSKPEGARWTVVPDHGVCHGGRVYAGVTLDLDADTYTLAREGEVFLAGVARSLEVE